MKKIPLHDYQIQAKDFIKQHESCALYLDMGMGKACDNDTMIPTPDGEKRLGDIKIGDYVIGRNGKPTAVKAVYPHKDKKAYEVTLTDGRSYICCDEHLTPYVENNEIKCKMLKDMLNDYADNRYEIPGCEPVEYKEKQHDISPRSYGFGLLCIGITKINDDYLIDSLNNRYELLAGIVRVDMRRSDYAEAVIPKDLLPDFRKLVYSMGLMIEQKDDYGDKINIALHKASDVKVYIEKIEQLANRDMTCLTVSAADHLFLINDYIVTHNTLTTLVALLEIKPQGHILVVAPKTIARATWTDEIADWEIPVRTQSLLVNEKGKPLAKAKRLKKYAEIYTNKPSMYFINRELLPDLVKYVTDNKLKWPFPTVVIDEMQSFKSPKSERFKALKKVRPQIQRVIGLSGTPAPNGLLDLWSQIYLLDMGKRLGKTQTYYKNTFFDVTRMYNGYAIEWAPKKIMPGLPFEAWLTEAYKMDMNAYNQLYQNQKDDVNRYYSDYLMNQKSAEEEIYDRISDICMSMENTHIKMPQLIMQDVYVQMDDDEKKLYKELRENSIVEFQDDTATVAANAAVLSAKLLQLASGTLYTDDVSEVDGYRSYKEIHTKKIDMCKYIIDNTNSPVLIAYHFKCDAKRLLESIDGAVLFDKTPEMIHDWNEGKIKVLLIQPASAGHGLNLQKGPGHTMIWFTIPWSLEEYQQTNARLYRQGQQNNVTIYRLFTKGTLDTKVANAIKGKAMTQDGLLDAIKATLEED